MREAARAEAEALGVSGATAVTCASGFLLLAKQVALTSSQYHPSALSSRSFSTLAVDPEQAAAQRRRATAAPQRCAGAPFLKHHIMFEYNTFRMCGSAAPALDVFADDEEESGSAGPRFPSLPPSRPEGAAWPSLPAAAERRKENTQARCTTT